MSEMCIFDEMVMKIDVDYLSRVMSILESRVRDRISAVHTSHMAIYSSSGVERKCTIVFCYFVKIELSKGASNQHEDFFQFDILESQNRGEI